MAAAVESDAGSDDFEKLARKEGTSRMTSPESSHDESCYTNGFIGAANFEETGRIKRTVGSSPVPVVS